LIADGQNLEVWQSTAAATHDLLQAALSID
jgi:hypothetical protein